MNNELILMNEAKINLAQNEAKTSKDIATVLKNFEVVFNKASIQKQRELLNYLVKNITVYKDDDINKRSQLKEITLQFSNEEIVRLNPDDSKNVWFTIGIGKTLKLSPSFPLLHTQRETFTSLRVPSEFYYSIYIT